MLFAPPSFWHEKRLCALNEGLKFSEAPVLQETQDILQTLGGDEKFQNTGEVDEKTGKEKELVENELAQVHGEINNHILALSPHDKKWWEEKMAETEGKAINALKGDGGLQAARKEIAALKETKGFYFETVKMLEKEAIDLCKTYKLPKGKLEQIQKALEKIQNESDQKRERGQKVSDMKEVLKAIPALGNMYQNFEETVATEFSSFQTHISLFSEKEKKAFDAQMEAAFKGDGSKVDPKTTLKNISKVVENIERTATSREKTQKEAQELEKSIPQVMQMGYRESLPHWKTLQKVFLRLAGDARWNPEFSELLNKKAQEMAQNTRVAEVHGELERTKESKDWESSIPIFERLLTDASGKDIPAEYQIGLQKELQEALKTAQENTEAKGEISNIRQEIDDLVHHADWDESLEGHQKAEKKLQELGDLKNISAERKQEIQGLQSEVAKNISLCTEKVEDKEEVVDLDELVKDNPKGKFAYTMYLLALSNRRTTEKSGGNTESPAPELLPTESIKNIPAEIPVMQKKETPKPQNNIQIPSSVLSEKPVTPDFHTELLGAFEPSKNPLSQDQNFHGTDISKFQPEQNSAENSSQSQYEKPSLPQTSENAAEEQPSVQKLEKPIAAINEEENGKYICDLSQHGLEREKDPAITAKKMKEIAENNKEVFFGKGNEFYTTKERERDELAEVMSGDKPELRTAIVKELQNIDLQGKGLSHTQIQDRLQRYEAAK
ncbi:MAG: hypothetical protein WCJ84_04810 [Candidatus Peregrinibacteria bacterium]